MKIANMLVLTLFSTLFLMGGAFAEYRVWTDKDGKTIDAEYVRVEVDSVVLRQKDGAEIRVARSSLGDKDRRFVMLQAPPRIEIKVSPSVDRRTVGYAGNLDYTYKIQYEIVEPSVTVRKTSSEPYDIPLTLEMVMVGFVQETGRYTVLDHVSVPFAFTSGNGNQFTYEGNPLDLQQIKGSLNAGTEYNGYLVVVRDGRGIAVGIKASKMLFEENAEALVNGGVGSVFTRKLRQVVPRQLPGGSGYNLPGRVF